MTSGQVEFVETGNERTIHSKRQRPVPTKPFFSTYAKWDTGARKKNWLSGHGLFANRPANTVSSLPSGTNRLSGHRPVHI